MSEFCLQAPNEIPDIINIRYPCYVQPKKDGYRGIYVPGEGFYSKSGKLFRNNYKLLEYFNNITYTFNHVLEGEFYIHGIKPQHLASYLNKEDAEISKELKFYIFDCIPIEDWLRKKCDISYENRLKKSRDVINQIICNYDKIIDMATDKVDNSIELKDLYKNYLYAGFEGIMIRDPNASYYWKRVTIKNGAVLKLKPYQTLDLEIIDLYEGEKALEGTLGGLICTYFDNAVRIGTGFTLVEREKIWLDKTIIGKIVEIKYLEVTENNMLRDPRFIRIRDDL